jgi:aromatic-L-amino-acid decarboxylase
MTPDEFRQAGHSLIDWIADYRSNIEDKPVLAPVSPGDIRRSFPVDAPTVPGSFDELLAALDTRVVPGTTMVQHPMHYGWFPSNASLASVLGDLASSGLGGLGISWESCPSLTEVEEVVCEWLRQLTGISQEWTGTITDTASTGIFTAVLAARERASGMSQNTGGLVGHSAPLVAYTTSQAHSSVAKAALLAGLGWDNIHLVDVDPRTRAMDPEALRSAMADDVATGRIPAVVIANVGSTGVTAMDPLGSIVEVARPHRAWVHVDAAMAGSAMLLPECRHLFSGLEGADSLGWNPHKWMGTILDCSLLYVRDTEQLTRVMSTNPSYLRSAADGEVTQYRDWGIPLGRRFRAMKLWFHLHLDGIEAIQARLRRDLTNAQWLAEQVEQAQRWKMVAPLTLQTVCVRHEPDGLQGAELDAHTLDWVNRINSSGAAYMTPAMLDDRWFVRISVGVESTEHHHVEALWALLQQTVA